MHKPRNIGAPHVVSRLQSPPSHLPHHQRIMFEPAWWMKMKMTMNDEDEASQFISTQISTTIENVADQEDFLPTCLNLRQNAHRPPSADKTLHPLLPLSSYLDPGVGGVCCDA